MQNPEEKSKISIEQTKIENFVCELDCIRSLCITMQNYAENIPENIARESEILCYRSKYIVTNLLYLCEREIERLKSTLDNLLSEAD